jgi:hypothetical protein
MPPAGCSAFLRILNVPVLLSWHDHDHVSRLDFYEQPGTALDPTAGGCHDHDLA